MNIIMQRFAVVTMIFAPLTLLTGFFGKCFLPPFLSLLTNKRLFLKSHFGALMPLLLALALSHAAGMNVPIPGPSMNLDEHDG